MTTDKRYIEGPIILKYNARSALAKMKRNKPEELNTIVTEILTALESLWIDKFTEMIYTTMVKHWRTVIDQSLLYCQRNQEQMNANFISQFEKPHKNSSLSVYLIEHITF